MTLGLGKLIESLDHVADRASQLETLGSSALSAAHGSGEGCVDPFGEDGVAEVFQLFVGKCGLHLDLLAQDTFDSVLGQS